VDTHEAIAVEVVVHEAAALECEAAVQRMRELVADGALHLFGGAARIDDVAAVHDEHDFLDTQDDRGDRVRNAKAEDQAAAGGGHRADQGAAREHFEAGFRRSERLCRRRR
jgi:hypothetical protein